MTPDPGPDDRFSSSQNSLSLVSIAERCFRLSQLDRFSEPGTIALIAVTLGGWAIGYCAGKKSLTVRGGKCERGSLGGAAEDEASGRME